MKTNEDLAVREVENKLALTRKEHTPKVGDIYMHRDEIYRLEKEVSPGYFETSSYSFLQKEWVRNGDYHKIGVDSLKQYYTLLLQPFESILSHMDDEDPTHDENIPDENVETIALYSRDSIEGKIDEFHSKIDNIEATVLFKRARLEELRRISDGKVRALEEKVWALQKNVRRLNRVISIIEVYTGKGLKITQISEGQGCAEDTPLSIRQLILYMDEEVAIVDERGNGIDYKDIDKFYEWLKDKNNRDLIVPEQRCAVVMKPRRYNRHYSSDRVENEMLNRYNHESYIILRDGENVYVCYSDELYFSEAAIPTQAQIKGLSDESWWNHREELAENMHYHSSFYGYLLQGLLDNTHYLGVSNGIKVMQGVNVDYIFDGEQDKQLGTGIKPFGEFIEEKNKFNRRGSRILFYGTYAHRGYGHFMRYYASQYSEPAFPDFGVYSLDDIPDSHSARFGFKYMPDDRSYYHERKNRETWLLKDSEDMYINYDNVSSEELSDYLTDRTQRKHYESVIPLMIWLRNEKRKEERDESAFRDLMNKELGGNISKELMDEAIEWWKTKVIYIRALKSDDKKSWNMIKWYLTKKGE